MSLHRFPFRLLFLSAATFLSLCPATIFADDDTGPDPGSSTHGVARLSIVTGDVSVRRVDSGDYVAAAINAPLVANDTIAIGPSGRAEVQFDSADMLRLDRDSEVRLNDVQYSRIGLQIARGTVTYRVLRDSTVQVELSTPTVSVRPAGRGMYRVSVLDNGQTEITVRSGQVEIFTPRGVEQLTAGQTMVARGSASDPEFQIVSAIPRDEWDNWNDSRDQGLERSVSYSRVSPDVYGAEDLDPYGRWVSDPSYGQVWAPTVAAGWAPYRDGRWVWIDYYGWTWIGNEPWGWAPYHYGRWFYGSPGWCWYPGPAYSHSYWSPALVGFFGFGRGGYNSFNFGFGNLGWVPLAPHESFHRWWGGGGGFGRGFNIVNGGNIFGSYRNARVLNAVTGIRSQDFASGRFNHFAVSRNQFNQAGLVRGGLPFQPGRQSYRFSDRQASFVPRGNSFSRPFSSSGNRSSGFSRGQVFTQSPRGGVGFGGQGNRDSGWNHFGDGRGSTGVTTTPRYDQRSQFGRSAGAPAAPINRDSGWNRFGNGRGSAGVTTAPRYDQRSQFGRSGGDSGWNQFGGGRGSAGVTTAPRYDQRSQFGRSAPSAPGNGGNRFGGGQGSAGLPAAPRYDQRGQFGRGGSGPSAPINRDSGWARGNAGGAIAPRQSTENSGRYVRNGGDFRGNAPMAAPRQSYTSRPAQEPMRGFGGGGRNSDRGGGFAARSMSSAPSSSGRSFGGGRAGSAPQVSGSHNGGGSHGGGGSHNDRHRR
jgi:hypothetical protein